MGADGRKDEAEATRLATEAMSRREEILKTYQFTLTNQKKYDEMVFKMEGKIRILKSEIANGRMS